MNSLIELQNLTKTFSHFTAVDDVCLSIREGEFLTLLGSSGSGKTTTLRLIAGLEEPTSGRILFRGKDITSVPTRLRMMRMVFQDYALFPHLSVADNVAFGLRLRAMKARYDDRKVKELVERHLEFVHLRGQGRKMPHQLSGGQKQRVALARALISDPPVVLFDEPLGSLDASLRKAMQFELKRIHDELGKTFIYVTHDQEEAMALSDRIVVMKDARILQIDTPQRIYHEPNSRAVAQFVGAANVIEGRLIGHGAGEAVIGIGASRIAVAGAAGSLESGAPVAVMLRSESLSLAPRSQGGQNSLQGTLVGRLFLGRSVEYQVRLDGSEDCLTVISSHVDQDYAEGAAVTVLVRREAARLLAG